MFRARLLARPQYDPRLGSRTTGIDADSAEGATAKESAELAVLRRRKAAGTVAHNEPPTPSRRGHDQAQPGKRQADGVVAVQYPIEGRIPSTEGIDHRPEIAL